MLIVRASQRAIAKLTVGVLVLWCSLCGVSSEPSARKLFSGDSKQVTVRQPGPDLRTRIHDLPSLAVLTEADSVAFAERELVREFDDPTSKHTIAVHFGKTRLKSLTDIEDVDVATLRGTAPRRSFNKTASTAGAVVDSVLRFGHTSTADFSNIFLPEKADLFEEEQIIESISAFTSTPERTDSLLQRMELSTRDLERVLSSKERHVGDVARLIDVLDNEFVISNPRSGAFELQQDLRLISDLIIVIVSAASGAVVSSLARQPVITGYLIAGSCIGPGGMGLVIELVQVETLAQFGVIFLLFTLGLEFSFSKLRRVQAVSLAGGTLEILLMIFLCWVVADFIGAPSTEGIFIGAFLSMSSTAVVVKCLMARKMFHSVSGQITVGTLILQDCTIGLLIALLPVLGGSHGIIEGVASLLRTAMATLIFICVALSISRTFVRATFFLVSRHGIDLYQMVAIAFCLTVAWMSEHLGLSIELGAFLAGLMISMTPFAGRTLQNIEPVRNILAALFLASIGIVMNPKFLWLHLDVLLFTFLVIVIFKCSLTALVIRAFGYDAKTSVVVGISMAQVGEFSFVLLARASNFGLVQRKLYLLLLGTTALSLIITPCLFCCTTFFLRPALAVQRLASTSNE